MDDPTPSFDFSESAEILAYFNQHGYVVIRNVLTPEEIKASVDEIWEHETLLGSNPQIKRNDPQTWTDEFWPTKGGGPGFLDSQNNYATKHVWENRQNPKIYQVFRSLFESLVPPAEEERFLQVKIDRFGIMRPTQNITLLDGSVVSHPEWQTKKSWLHWDQNPWSEPGFKRLQGLVALTDHTDTSGGFDCVPGFQNEFTEWAERTPIETTGHSLQHENIKVPLNDPIWQRVKHITMKAGSLCIWDSRLPHQNYPNNDNNWRIVQYLTYYYLTKEDAENKQDHLIKSLQCGIIPTSFLQLMTPLGRKVFGLQIDENEVEVTIEPLTEAQKEALVLLKDANAAEAAGDSMKSAQLFRRAFKLNPMLEDVFNQGEG